MTDKHKDQCAKMDQDQEQQVPNHHAKQQYRSIVQTDIEKTDLDCPTDNKRQNRPSTRAARFENLRRDC